MRWLSNNEKFNPCYIRTMKVPVASLGPHTIVLNKYIETPCHLILHWPKDRKKYYCGFVKEQKARMMLLSDIQTEDNVESTKERIEVSYSVIHSWVVNRCKYQTIPDCQSTHSEWTARWIIFNVISNKDKWLIKEKERLNMLMSEFDLSNLQKIYPEVKTMKTAVNDMIELYTSSPHVMDTDKISNLLGWLDDYFY